MGIYEKIANSMELEEIQKLNQDIHVAG